MAAFTAITYEGRPLLKPAKIDGEPIDKLLDLLKEPEDRVRYRARIELGRTRHPKGDCCRWKMGGGSGSQGQGLRASHDGSLVAPSVPTTSSTRPYSSGCCVRPRPTPGRRRRMCLCYWRDLVNDPLALLRVQIHDANPRVRMEAVRALSFFHNESALAVAVELLASPIDRYLDFAFNETLNTLERRLSAGKLNRSNIAASLLKILNNAQLDAERKETLIEAICRNGSADELKAIWDKTLEPKEFTPTQRSRALEWLTEAAATRRVKPAVESAQVLRLLKETDAGLLPEAVGLAAAWKVKETASYIQRLARDGKASQPIRFAALDGLATLGDPDSVKVLRDLTAKANPLAIQFHAAGALAQVDLEAGARRCSCIPGAARPGR